MALSVLERIAQNVLQTMAGVTTDRGYSLTLTPVRETMITEPAHLLAVLSQMPAEENKDTYIQTMGWSQMFAIVVYVMPAETDTTPIDTYSNEAAAGLQKELMIDVTRGGLAWNTEILPPIFFPPVDGTTSGITFTFLVKYRTALDNPYVGAT